MCLVKSDKISQAQAFYTGQKFGLICQVLAAIVVLFTIRDEIYHILVNWRTLRGWEPYLIGQALAEGHGFSFPSTNRWLFESSEDGGFHATAWIDPVYPRVLAVFIWAFGDFHPLAAGIFNLLLMALVFGLVFHLGARLISPAAGLLGVLLLAKVPFALESLAMVNAMLSAFVITLSALVLVIFFEKPSFGRALLLGLTMGVTISASPTAQYFIPATVLAILVLGRRDLLQAFGHACLMVVMVACVLAPWAYRNHQVFDELVLVRNGAGQIAFVGSLATAATVQPDLIKSEVKPDWRAETPREAVQRAKKTDYRRELERFQREYAAELAPEGYENMNEAQRDAWFFDETKRFLMDNPALSFKLGVAKLELFLNAMFTTGVLALCLAVFSILFAFRIPALFPLVLWLGAYTAPFVLIVCYFGRYRAPIEPIICIMASISLVTVAHILAGKLFPLEERAGRAKMV